MGGRPILLVDDHPSNLKLARAVLTKAGYDVRTATNADDALAILESFRPALILMDLQLPGMDGFELARRLKASPATQDMIILALTAYAMKGDDERALAAGCDGYIAKPIDTRALPALVARWLTTG